MQLGLGGDQRGGAVVEIELRSGGTLDQRGLPLDVALFDRDAGVDDVDRLRIEFYVGDEVVMAGLGVVQPGAITGFQRVINRMKSEGCDGVVLGCTEIPLIMNDSNSPLPTLDSTRLLARAALRRFAIRERRYRISRQKTE